METDIWCICLVGSFKLFKTCIVGITKVPQIYIFWTQKGRAGVRSALVSPEESYPGGGMGGTEGSCKSLQFSVCLLQRWAALNLFYIVKTCVVDTHQPHPQTTKQGGLGSSSAATSYVRREEIKDPRRQLPSALLLQIREHYVLNDILSSFTQNRGRQLYWDERRERGAP